MGTTTYGLNDALAVKLWSKKLAVEATNALDIARCSASPPSP